MAGRQLEFMSRLRSQKKLTLIGKLITSWKIFHNDFKIVLFSKKLYHWWWRIWYIFYIHGGSLNRFYHFIDFIMVFFSFGIILNSSNILFRLRLWFHSFGIGFITFWWFRNWSKISKREKNRFYVLVDSKLIKSTPIMQITHNRTVLVLHTFHFLPQLPFLLCHFPFLLYYSLFPAQHFPFLVKWHLVTLYH